MTKLISQISTTHAGAIDDNFWLEMEAADNSGRKVRPSHLLNQPGANLAAAAAAFSGSVTAAELISTGGVSPGQVSNWYLYKSGSDPLINFDANDFIVYDRTNDLINLGVAGSTQLQVGNGNVGVGGVESGVALKVATALHGIIVRGTAADKFGVYAEAQHASFSSHVVSLNAYRAANSGYSFLTAYSGNGGDLEAHIRGDGEAFCDGSWTGGGADYAEYFETADGSAIEPGVSVVLDGAKVRPAAKSDPSSRVVGVVSVNPTVVGDAAWNNWSGKYVTDDFGAYIMEDYEVIEWLEPIFVERLVETAVLGSDGRPAAKTERVRVDLKRHAYALDALPDGLTAPPDATRTTQQRRKLNPKFDPSHEYVPREKRPEWVTVGLMGKLPVRKGQPVGDRWIKMRDVSDGVEQWLVR